MRFEFLSSPLLTWVEKFLHDHPTAHLYVVGGAVRDELRGRTAKDLDLVIGGVEASALERWLQAHGTVSFVGKRFGVWKFSPHHDPGNPTIDIAIPRKDVSLGTEGGYRNVLVKSDPFLPIEEDLARRDFTYNAMAYSWREDRLIDPFDGQHDLTTQTLRTVGHPEERFREDSSRMLRALRFACSLNHTIESSTWETLKQLSSRLHLEQDGRRVVARELMAEEFIKTFESNPQKSIDLYQASGVWSELFSNHSTTQLSSYLNQAPEQPRRELLLALLCFDVFKQPSETYDWLHLWRFEMHANVSAITEVVRTLSTNPKQVTLAQIERQLLPHRELLTDVLLATQHDNARVWLERLLLVFKHHDLPSLITEKDLMNIPEGPKRGEAVQAIRSAQLAGEMTTKKEALELLATLRKW